LELTIHQYASQGYGYSVYGYRDFLGNPIRNFREILGPYIFQGLQGLALGATRFHQAIEIMGGFAKDMREFIGVRGGSRESTCSLVTR
jgi:hypothetical protein